MEIRRKKIEKWKKIEDEVLLGKIKAPYPKKICSDCKFVIETFGNIEELSSITSCPRCYSGNLEIIKGKHDELYKKYMWYKIIYWWAALTAVLILGPTVLSVIPIIGEPVAALILQEVITKYLLHIMGVAAAVVLAAVFLLGWEKYKERKKAEAWELEDQLKELKEQLGRGVITQEEYEQKKKQLLEKSSVIENKGNA